MLKQKIPAFRQGKHSVRLYADRTRRAQPGTPQPPAGGVLKGKVKGVMQKKGQKGEPHEKENRYPYRQADPSRKSCH